MGRFCLAVVAARTFPRQKKKRSQRPSLGRRNKRLTTMQNQPCVAPLRNFRLWLTIQWLVYLFIVNCNKTVLSINDTDQYEWDGR
eukprot:scaffold352022_cov15-Prasinocladus_malaysianus.AAC.1